MDEEITLEVSGAPGRPLEWIVMLLFIIRDGEIMIDRYIIEARDQPHGAYVKKDKEGAFCYFEDYKKEMQELIDTYDRLIAQKKGWRNRAIKKARRELLSFVCITRDIRIEERYD